MISFKKKKLILFIVLFVAFFFQGDVDAFLLALLPVSYQIAIGLHLALLAVMMWDNPNVFTPVVMKVSLVSLPVVPSPEDKTRSQIQPIYENETDSKPSSSSSEQFVEVVVREVTDQQVAANGQPSVQQKPYTLYLMPSVFNNLVVDGQIWHIEQFKYEKLNYGEMLPRVLELDELGRSKKSQSTSGWSAPLPNTTMDSPGTLNSSRSYIDEIVTKTVYGIPSKIVNVNHCKPAFLNGLPQAYLECESSNNGQTGIQNRAYNLYQKVEDPVVEQCPEAGMVNNNGICNIEGFTSNQILEIGYSKSSGFKNMLDSDQKLSVDVTPTSVKVPIYDKRYGKGTLTVSKASKFSDVSVTQKFVAVPLQKINGVSGTATIEVNAVYSATGVKKSDAVTGEQNSSGPGSGGGGEFGEGDNLGGVWMTDDGLGPVEKEDVCLPGEKVNANGTCGGLCLPGGSPGSNGMCECPVGSPGCECPAGSPGRDEAGECRSVCPVGSGVVQSQCVCVDPGTIYNPVENVCRNLCPEGAEYQVDACVCLEPALTFNETENICSCPIEGQTFDESADVRECIGAAPSAGNYGSCFISSFSDVSEEVELSKQEYLDAIDKFKAAYTFSFDSPSSAAKLPCFGPWDFFGYSTTFCLDSFSEQFYPLKYLFPFTFGLFSIGIIFGAYRARKRRRKSA